MELKAVLSHTTSQFHLNMWLSLQSLATLCRWMLSNGLSDCPEIASQPNDIFPPGLLFVLLTGYLLIFYNYFLLNKG
jgi:hypothetical protein